VHLFFVWDFELFLVRKMNCSKSNFQGCILLSLKWFHLSSCSTASNIHHCVQTAQPLNVSSLSYLEYTLHIFVLAALWIHFMSLLVSLSTFRSILAKLGTPCYITKLFWIQFYFKMGSMCAWLLFEFQLTCKFFQPKHTIGQKAQ